MFLLSCVYDESILYYIYIYIFVAVASAAAVVVVCANSGDQKQEHRNAV